MFSVQELVAINIAKKIGRIPCEVTGEDIRQLATVFSAKEQEAVVNAATAMGFLNRFMCVFLWYQHHTARARGL